jgi:hypothetical protein
VALNDRLGTSLATFCALVPLTDADAARAEIERWPLGSDSPFTRLEQVHFARLVIIPGLERQVADQPADDLAAPYLMFSVFFDGERDALLTALCEELSDEADGAWRHCRDYPGHPRDHGATFRRWLEDHRVAATAIFGAYPDASVADVRRALAFRERFRAFAFGVEAQRTTRGAFDVFDAGLGGDPA